MIIDGSSDLICTHDLEGRILSVNAVAARALGVPRDALLHRNIREVLLPSIAKGWDDYIARIRNTGSASGSMVVRDAKGRVQTWEYHNTLGNDDVVSGIARDVTDREAAIRAMRESEERYRSIIENVSDLITIIDADATIRYSSPSITTLAGYTPAEMNGCSFFDLVDREDAGRAVEFIDRQIATREASTIELRFRHRNGSLRYVEVIAKTLRRGNRVAGIIATTRDITDRRLLEAQLERADRLASLGRLAATVAHEFNNVLMGMQPFTELMQRDGASRKTAAKGAWHIGNSIARGKRIVQDILRYTQPAEPMLRSVNVAAWWNEIEPEIDALTSNEIAVVTNFADEELSVLTDAAQLTQVIMNLVTNARDAMPKGGTVTLHARRPRAGETFAFGVVEHPQACVQFSVSDTGCGIPADGLQQIFEPLFTSKPAGNGLGLAVAHQVVTRHGGSIFVESTVGQGTTFHIFLRSGGQAPPPVVTIEKTLSAPLRTRKILLVDDEPTIIEGVGTLLREEDFEVSTAASGEEAIGMFDAFEPDIVVLDVGLPGIDGPETCRRLRATRPSLPVIFSSGHEGGDSTDDYTRYLQKPFAMNVLIDTIAELEAHS